MNSNIIISYIFIGITPRDILQPAHTAKSWLHFTFMHLFYFIYLFSRRFYPKWLTNKDIIEAIKTNKRATTCKCYYKSWLA